VLGQLLARKVLDDEEVGLQVLAQRQLLFLESLLGDQIPDQVEDRAAQDSVALLDGLVADGPGAVRFSQARSSQEDGTRGLADKLAARQVVDLLSWDQGIKVPVEGVQGLRHPEAGGT
jgi:hypothetical protein